MDLPAAPATIGCEADSIDEGRKCRQSELVEKDETNPERHMADAGSKSGCVAIVLFHDANLPKLLKASLYPETMIDGSTFFDTANEVSSMFTLKTGSVLSLAFAATLALATAPTIAAEMTLKANVPGNEEGIAYSGVKRFADIVKDKTGGKIAVKVFHSSALGDQVSSIESMQAGTLDIATVETPITTVDPVLGATALPYIFRGREHIAAALGGSAGNWIEERLAAKGLRVLGFLEGGFRQITNNKRPVVKPSDLKGVKMRTPSSKLRIKVFNTYGANASPLPFKELYTALQTGAFDGQENPVIWAKVTKFYEVQKYLSITNHLYTVTYLLMSDKAFQKLPAETQKILKEAGRAAAAHTVEVGKKADGEIVDFLKSKGMAVNNADIPAFVAASKPIWGDWAKETGGDAQKLIDAIANTK